MKKSDEDVLKEKLDIAIETLKSIVEGDPGPAYYKAEYALKAIEEVSEDDGNPDPWDD